MNARLSLKQEEIQSKQRRLEAIREIESAHLQFRNSLRSLKQAKLLMEQAREALQLAKAKYELGGISSLQLFDSESRYLEAELSWVSAVYDYLIAKEQLNSAVGMEVVR